MIAAIYARKSTEQNGVADEAKSVARQIEHATAYAERKGWAVDERFIYVDDGISGAEFAKRPGFIRLMNALKPAQFQVLVMSEESRLGRESIETSYAVKQLVTAGVRVFSYLQDRELKLDSPTDKFLLAALAFTDEVERDKARQRTYDAMIRKARAGHVTGGRVFGYDNERTEKGHVERRINEAEAAVVRRIFELCAKGFGQVAIAKKLNDEGAVSPRAQQGRPNAWASSSIREALYRDLYRGEIVWNRTQKRDSWGKVDPTARPESEWLRVPVPKLRIVTDAQWEKAHARLQQTRDAYLRSTGGQLWGRPLDGVARKYLLTGLARCGCCGGSLEVRSRNHGKDGRTFYYACSSYFRRGKSVCSNGREIPLAAADDAVIGAVQDALLTPAFIDSVVRKVLARVVPQGALADETRVQLRDQIDQVGAELDRLIEALAKSGMSASVTTAIKKREAAKAQLEQQLSTLDCRQQVSQGELQRVEELARAKAAEWRTLLRRHTPQARQILSKMLRDKLLFVPEARKGKAGWRFTGEATVTALLAGTVPELSHVVASPRGTGDMYWAKKPAKFPRVPGRFRRAA